MFEAFLVQHDIKKSSEALLIHIGTSVVCEVRSIKHRLSQTLI